MSVGFIGGGHQGAPMVHAGTRGRGDAGRRRGSGAVDGYEAVPRYWANN